MNGLLTLGRQRKPSRPIRLNRRGKVLWTTGNFLMLVGVYLLLFVGGLVADEQFNLMAAQGDSGIGLPEEPAPAPRAAAKDAPVQAGREAPPLPKPQRSTAPEPAQRFRLPELNNPGGGRELNSLVPAQSSDFGPSSVTRIVIPRLGVDRKVIEVGWKVEDLQGQQVAIWDVAKYAVGHHEGTANPGQPGNIVMAGHSGGRAYPFNDIYYLKPGDEIVLWSNGQQFQYTVGERLVLDEIGPNVTMEQRRANARYIEPTDEEVVTLVTCWPLTGKDKFNQRVVIRAHPPRPAQPDPVADTIADPAGAWSAR